MRAALAAVLALALVGCSSPEHPTAPRAGSVDDQRWAEIVADPVAHMGESITIYGEMTPFYSRSEWDGRAYTANTAEALDRDAVLALIDGRDALSTFVDSDVFRAEVTVVGVAPYEQGGSGPVFHILSVTEDR